MTLQDLQKIEKRFVSLPRKLDTELYNTCPAVLKIKIDDITLYLSTTGSLLTGPQILLLILESFEVDDNLAGARSVTDLMAIQWLGDKPHQKTRFLKIFLNVVQNLKDSQFTQEGLRDVLAKCMLQSVDLKFEMESYKIAPIGSPVHSFAYLIAILVRSIQRDRTGYGHNHS